MKEIGRKTMKSIIFLAAAALILLLAGCSENGTSVNQPTTSNKELIKLPPQKALSTELQFSVTKKVNGKKGGSILLAGSYFSLSGKLVVVTASLRFPAGAFEGEREITMTADDQYAAVSFYPHMVFEKPLNLTLMFAGLDLSDLNLSNGKVGFYYIDDQGNMTQIYNKGVVINNRLGSAMVLNARIEHFSRYAFAK